MQSWLSEDRYSPTYNWLVLSKSPYLKQHEKNPVNWFEWSEEVFAKANREDKPVFMSIGYSASRWCDIMNRESYEDEETAMLLNERFIAIKVDREERADIASTFMNVSKRTNRQESWPLNIFLTPEQKPFYVCTYMPKIGSYGAPSFIKVIVDLYDYFQENQDKINNVDDETLQSYWKNKMV